MTIHKVVEVAIKPGKAVEFQEIARVFIQRVQNSEPNTLSYEWFLNDDHESCYILEIYQDDEALLYHLDNIRDLYGDLFKVCVITRLQVFGKISEEVRSAHLPQTEFYDHWAGITRMSTRTS